MSRSDEPRAAVALIERAGKLLVVWNRRYGGWACPGGKVEPGEAVRAACARELLEETGLIATRMEYLYEGADSRDERGRPRARLPRVPRRGVRRATRVGAGVPSRVADARAVLGRIAVRAVLRQDVGSRGKRRSALNTKMDGKTDGRKMRGFASMDKDRRREIASQGGKASHEQNRAHVFSLEEARIAGRKGGKIISRDREHMKGLGRRGGKAAAVTRARRAASGSDAD